MTEPRRAKILVIDDEAGMLRAVERILSPEHDVTSASTPAEGLTLVHSTNPDLVICDIGMPRMDGFEVMQRLKQTHPELDVILMTGMSDPDTHMVRAIRERAFYFIEKPFNREVMRTLVERCLELRRLREAEKMHRARIDRELAEARSFQQTMLPPTKAVIEGVAIDARCVACSELGGDIFDYASAGPGRAAVLVADVAGHGMSAALLTAVVKAAFRSSAVDGFEPVAVVRRVAQGIAGFSARRFVTLVVARIERSRATMEFVSAGHPPVIVRAGDAQVKLLDATGPLVSPAFGLDEWEQHGTPFHEGDSLLVYTDGITESSGETGLFTRRRLIEHVRSTRETGAALLESILSAVHEFSGERAAADDLTLLTASLVH
jgi:sigma-B regulation protein RsbU (phosphoserine phosphatase)